MEQLVQAARSRGLLGGDGEAVARRDAHRASAPKFEKVQAAAQRPTTCRSIRCAPARRSPTSVGENAIVIGDGGDFVATAASVVRVYQSGPLARSGAARHARRRSRVTPWRRSWPSPTRRSSSSTATARSACTPWSSRPACARRSTSSASSATTPAWTQIRRGQVQLYGEERAVATALSLHALREGRRGARRPRRVRRAAGGDPSGAAARARRRQAGAGQHQHRQQRFPEGHLDLIRWADGRSWRDDMRHGCAWSSSAMRSSRGRSPTPTRRFSRSSCASWAWPCGASWSFRTSSR